MIPSTLTRPCAWLVASAALLLHLTGAVLGAQTARSRVAPPDTLVAIVGATIIDGNGGTPVSDATIVVRGKRIAALGPRASTQVPKGARVVDGAGKFITPGFIDTNVHLSLYNNGESMVRYEDRFLDLITEAAQTELKYGITTVRDSYGALLPLITIRDSIAHGKLIGPRILVAGNIVGWGGPKSPIFSNAVPATLFDEQMMDFIAQGAGEELLDMSPDELRVAMRAYLDKGPNFVKYGGTSHTNNLITFSPRQQEALVDEVHKRGLIAETHSTNPEPLRISVLAGVDLIQHPEVHDMAIPDDLVKLIVDRKVICSILSNTITAKPWQDYVKSRQRADSARADSLRNDTLKVMQRAKTGWELRNERRTQGMAFRRANAEKLIASGCITTPSTDTYLRGAPEFLRAPRTDFHQMPGTATLAAIEGLVELGMTPSQAIVAATKNGAIASQGLEDFGTLEVGKRADLLVLDADPLADIHNIRKLSLVMRDGRIIDRDKLPEKPVWTRPKPKA
ncbi:MAG TPA: amidohydrolase family protein [Gemmatimonadaceae bacterium]|nr:amidohydrolase family protein [Gemmatimonadaceae bacterium]